MKRILIYFLILLAAVWLGLKMQADPGYVLIVYRNLSIESTLWLAILSLVFIFLFFYCLIRFVHLSRVLPKKILIWWYKHSEQKATRLTNIGIFKLIEKNWSSAEKILIKAARSLPNPLLNYIEAAYAANKQSAYLRRDNYLNKAYAAQEKTELFVGIIQAKMQLKSKQLEQALATLKRLQDIKSHHKIVLKLLSAVYFDLHDWKALKDLLKTLDRYDVLPPQDFYTLKTRIYLEILQENFDWQVIPKDLRVDDEIVYCYTKHLISKHLEITAEKLVYEALNKKWSLKLLTIYPQTISEHPTKQLARVEKWLKLHKNDPDLLLCLGRMCKNMELWGKARNYLENSIKLSPKAETYLELGEIMEKYDPNNEHKDALECYRKGLKEILNSN